MLRRLCDRCGVPAVEPNKATTVLIPPQVPATAPVDGDCEVLVALSTDGKDLCSVCQTSALVEYALRLLAASLTAERLAGWSARINGVMTAVAR